MSGAELPAEPSCLGTVGIDPETRTEFGGDILCACVLATSDVDAWSMLATGIGTGKLLENIQGNAEEYIFHAHLLPALVDVVVAI